MAGRRQESPQEVDAAERTRRIDAICGESKLKHTETKRLMAETLVDLTLELQLIRAKRAAGTIKADEVRIIPGLGQAIARMVDRLGVTAEDADNLIEEDDDWDDL